MATKANKSNVLPIFQSYLERIEQIGIDRREGAEKSEQCKLDALFIYGDAVNEGVAHVSFNATKRKNKAEPDNAEQFVDIYFKGYGRVDNRNITVSQFRLAAFPEVLAQRAEILKACKEQAKLGREAMGDKSLYNVFLQTCGKIKKAKDAGKKIPSIAVALKETVKPAKGKAAAAPAKKTKPLTPEQELTNNKKLFLTFVRDLKSLPAKNLPTGAKKLMEQLFNLKWNIELETA